MVDRLPVPTFCGTGSRDHVGKRVPQPGFGHPTKTDKKRRFLKAKLRLIIQGHKRAVTCGEHYFENFSQTVKWNNLRACVAESTIRGFTVARQVDHSAATSTAKDQQHGTKGRSNCAQVLPGKWNLVRGPYVGENPTGRDRDLLHLSRDAPRRVSMSGEKIGSWRRTSAGISSMGGCYDASGTACAAVPMSGALIPGEPAYSIWCRYQPH